MNPLSHYTFDDRQVRLLLPHRPPMLLIDLVSSCPRELDRIETGKNLTAGEVMLARNEAGRGFFRRLWPSKRWRKLADC